MEWRLAEAEDRFPAEGDYEKPTGTRPSFKEFLFGRDPDADLEGMDLTRDRSSMRETKL